MSDCYSNDYDKFIGKYITVIYDCGSKCKKLHCKLIEYCEKSSKEKLIILKAHNNTTYHMNCDKIIYWSAEYEDIPTDNQDTYKSNTKSIESNTVPRSEDLPSEKISLQPNEDINYDELQENNVILSEDDNKSDTSLEPIVNTPIISDEHDINYIITDTESSHDKVITDYKKDCDSDKALKEYNNKDIYKKNVLRSPLAAFINCNFQGVYLTIYTASTQAISGEVIFNYDYLIVLKSDGKTYYINPEQITYFC